MMKLGISALFAIYDFYAFSIEKVLVEKDLLPASLKRTLAVNFAISFAGEAIQNVKM